MKYLEHLTQQARNAFYWTSFDPDKRGKQTIDEHELQLQSDLLSIPESEHERYIEKYVSLFSHWLSAHSRCASSAITGGSGFNVRRAGKASNSERNAYTAFDEWRAKAKTSIAKRTEQNKPEAQKFDERLESLKAQISQKIEWGSVANCYSMIERLAYNGEVELVKECLILISTYNDNHKKPFMTSRHKVWGLPEIAEKSVVRKEERAEKENQELLIVGGKVVYNYAIDRLQLVFDEKPVYNIISALKHSGFRWAPSETAWQRQLTNNAIYSTKMFLKENNLFIPKEL